MEERRKNKYFFIYSKRSIDCAVAWKFSILFSIHYGRSMHQFRCNCIGRGDPMTQRIQRWMLHQDKTSNRFIHFESFSTSKSHFRKRMGAKCSHGKCRAKAIIVCFHIASRNNLFTFSFVIKLSNLNILSEKEKDEDKWRWTVNELVNAFIDKRMFPLSLSLPLVRSTLSPLHSSDSCVARRFF